ncbi:MAG: hypothetical protein WBP13_01390 [Methylophilaceae bacterium]
MPKFKILLLLVPMFVVVGCSDDSKYSEITGSSQERIAKIVKILHFADDKKTQLTTSILDAHLFQQRLGSGGGMGPTDYCDYYALKVAPTSIDMWQSNLQPFVLNVASNQPYSAPEQAKTWWLTQPKFSTLALYDAFPLTRAHGWVGVLKTGDIYIKSCTT